MKKKLNLNKIVETFNKALKIAKKEGVNFIAISGYFGSTIEVVEAKTAIVSIPAYGLKKSYVKPRREKVIIATLREGVAILDDFQCEELFENSKRWIDYKKEKR